MKNKKIQIEANAHNDYYMPGTCEIVTCNGHGLTLEYPSPDEYDAADLRAENLMNIVEMFAGIYWPDIPSGAFSKIVDALSEGRPYNGRKMKMKIYRN